LFQGREHGFRVRFSLHSIESSILVGFLVIAQQIPIKIPSYPIIYIIMYVDSTIQKERQVIHH
jgi:hypothetical protein